jgi:hypothetical protein
VIEKRKSGMRCRAKSTLHSPIAIIQPGDQGTIAYEVENLGRRLILVQWDNGASMYAFAEEIEIMEGNGPAEIS